MPSKRRDGCPCTILEEPCHRNCSCANPGLSGGCHRCARYGSEEQRRTAARGIADTLDGTGRRWHAMEAVCRAAREWTDAHKACMKAFSEFMSIPRNERGLWPSPADFREPEKARALVDAVDTLTALDVPDAITFTRPQPGPIAEAQIVSRKTRPPLVIEEKEQE